MGEGEDPEYFEDAAQQDSGHSHTSAGVSHIPSWAGVPHPIPTLGNCSRSISATASFVAQSIFAVRADARGSSAPTPGIPQLRALLQAGAVSCGAVPTGAQIQTTSLESLSEWASHLQGPLLLH